MIDHSGRNVKRFWSRFDLDKIVFVGILVIIVLTYLRISSSINNFIVVEDFKLSKSQNLPIYTAFVVLNNTSKSSGNVSVVANLIDSDNLVMDFQEVSLYFGPFEVRNYTFTYLKGSQYSGAFLDVRIK